MSDRKSNGNAVVEQLTGQVAALRARVAGLEAEIAAARGGTELVARTPRRRSQRAGVADRDAGGVSRRHLFELLGGAAAAGVGLAVAGSVLAPDAVDATTGNMQFGASNDAGAAATSFTSTNASLTFAVGNTGTGAGVVGTTVSQDAVRGTSINSAGVAGSSTNSSGVFAFSTNQNSVFVAAPTANSAGAHMRLEPTGAGAGPPTAGAHLLGQFWVDTPGVLWQCVVAGTPGTWMNLTSGSKLMSITPARVYDSRVGQQPATGPKSPIANASIVTLDVTGPKAGGGNTGVPSGASAVLGNVTVVNGVNPGVFLTVYAAGTSAPATSSVNAGSGAIVANSFTSQIGTTGMNANRIAVTCGGGPTDLIIDVLGYYL